MNASIGRFLRVPLFAFLLVQALCLLLREVGGIRYSELGQTAQLLLIGDTFALLLGSFVMAAAIPKRNEGNPMGLVQAQSSLVASDTRASIAVKWLAFFSVIYIATRAIDVAMNPLVLIEGVTVARYENKLDGPRGSVIGMLAVLCSGAPIVLSGLIVHRKIWMSLGKWQWRRALLILLLSAAAFGTTGGRGYIGVAILFAFLIHLVSRVHYERVRRPRRMTVTRHGARRAVVAAALLLAFALFWTTIAEQRESYRDRSMPAAMANIEQTFSAEVWLPSTPAAYAYTSALLYGTMSYNEFSTLVTQDVGGRLGGAYHTYLINGFLANVGFPLPTVREIVETLPRSGAFVGIFGAVYIDFDFVGSLLFFAVLGGVMQAAYEYWRRRRTVQADIILALALMFAFASPMGSLPAMGFGWSVILFSMFSGFLLRRVGVH